MSAGDLIWMVVGFILTLMVFSYLVGDNFLFRIVIFAFVGVSAAYAVLVVFTQILWPHVILAIMQGDAEVRLVGIAGFLLSLLMGTKLFPRLARLGNVSMAYLVGVGAAVAIVGAVAGTIVPQFMNSINIDWLRKAPSQEVSTWMPIINGATILVGMITTLVSFHYGAKRGIKGQIRRGWFVNGLSWVGRGVLAVTFGAVFAGVFSSALTALVDRIAFLINVIRILVQ